MRSKVRWCATWRFRCFLEVNVWVLHDVCRDTSLTETFNLKECHLFQSKLDSFKPDASVEYESCTPLRVQVWNKVYELNSSTPADTLRFLLLVIGFCTTPPVPLCDSVEFILAAVAECVSTDAGCPAPAPRPVPTLGPAERLPVLLPWRQQEHHTGGHQDVPQWMCVVVVVLGLGENVQTHPDQGTECPRD